MPKVRTQTSIFCMPTLWQGRGAWALGNDLVEMVVLPGGGHVAEFRFSKSSGFPTLSPLWVPPWKTIDPHRYRTKEHTRQYGPPITGRMLAGIAGHNLCLDCFGAPSEEETEQGISIHGEAPSLLWKGGGRAAGTTARLTLGVRLPAAGLRFGREIAFRRGEPVAYFHEMVTNERKMDHFFHWVEHVTLGPPFLDRELSRIFVSASRGHTFPHGYEGKALLESSRDFRWPNAPGAKGKAVDLSQPFLQPGLGLLVTLLLDPRREVEFIAALNHHHHLLIGYCFRRQDFPWMATWEENKARTDAPWNGKTQARGLEFGSTPFPVGRLEAFSRGPLFGAPSFSVVPAKGRKAVRYVAFLAQVPEDFVRVNDIRTGAGEIVVRGADQHGKSRTIRIPAAGMAATGLA
jgi:hypothetical protein